MEYRIDALPPRICIGKQGDNGWLQVRLDVSAWKTLYPAGVCSLLYLRPDGTLYPVTLAASGSVVTWTVSSADTAVSGLGKAELRITENTLIRKSVQVAVIVEPSLGEGRTASTAGTPSSDWLTTLEGYAVRAENASTNAQNASVSMAGAIATHNTADSAHNVRFAAKQDTISDLAAIRSGAALGATALQSHQSLSGYATETWVEEKGYLTAHQSLAAYRSAAAQDVIDAGKVSKETGKALSSNDYTTDEKNRLAAAVTYGAESGRTDAQKNQAMRNISIIKTAMDSTAVAGAQYYLGEQSAVTVALPSTAEAGQEITVVFYSGATAATLTVTGAGIGTAPTPAANQRIELNCLWDGVCWCLLSRADAYEAVSADA